MISVVVPLLNEERTLERLYREIAAALGPLGQFEVVFVDDGSSDQSRDVLGRLHAEEPNVIVVHLRRNFGKAAALQAGFMEAQGDVIVTIDADLQDDPAEIPRLLAKLDEGFDLVSGWKTQRSDRWTRRIVSRLFNWGTALVSGARLHDMNCGLKAYRAEVVKGLRLYGELHRFIPVLAAYRGFRIAEVPVRHRPREHGQSRYGLERYLRGLLDLLTVTFMGRYRHRPLHLFGGIGLAMGLVGFLILIYLTGLKIAGQGIGHRPLLILGVLLVVVGIQLVSLGLLSELITSQHEQRMSDRERLDPLIDEVRRARNPQAPVEPSASRARAPSRSRANAPSE
ncbi:MAG TPA: glycosyltransferase family 2 protein [Gaiellaceae bacterium]|nr:glycosyltransferase family 2 protein [Gaiellaceae bacterium]